MRAEAKEALASAGDLDAKTATAFDAGSTDLAVNIDGLSRYIAALKKGTVEGTAEGSLLQSGVVSYIRKLAMNAYIVSDEDRSTLLPFLFWW